MRCWQRRVDELAAALVAGRSGLCCRAEFGAVGDSMTISLAQLMVPAHDKETSAEFFARIFGLSYLGADRHFSAVRINPGLVVIFETRVSFPHQHYSFRVTEAEFNEIFGRMREEGLRYGSRPLAVDDMEIQARRSGRRFHFHDPSGHLFEVRSEGPGE